MRIALEVYLQSYWGIDYDDDVGVYDGGGGGDELVS